MGPRLARKRAGVHGQSRWRGPLFRFGTSGWSCKVGGGFLAGSVLEARRGIGGGYSGFMFGTRMILLSLVLAGVLAAGVVMGVLAARRGNGVSTPVLANTPTILRQVQGLSEYVTVKYVMEKVVLLEDVRWYGDNRVLMVAHGVVKAGLDLREVDAASIVVSGRRLTLQLPPPAITEVYLDDRQTQVVERSTGMLRVFDKSLEQQARARALEEIERAARFAGILAEAEDNARRQLRALLTGLGYEVEFR